MAIGVKVDSGNFYMAEIVIVGHVPYTSPNTNKIKIINKMNYCTPVAGSPASGNALVTAFVTAIASTWTALLSDTYVCDEVYQRSLNTYRAAQFFGTAASLNGANADDACPPSGSVGKGSYLAGLGGRSGQRQIHFSPLTVTSVDGNEISSAGKSLLKGLVAQFAQPVSDTAVSWQPMILSAVLSTPARNSTETPQLVGYTIPASQVSATAKFGYSANIVVGSMDRRRERPQQLIT